ncbi:MAG: PAS domain S-box protein, partial [Woeseia sp.]
MTEHKLKNSLLNVGALAVFTDPQGHVLDANPWAIRLSAAQEHDIAGKHLADCPWFVGMEQAGESIREAISVSASNRTVRREVDIRLAGDERHAFEFTFVPALDDDENVTGLIISGIDVSIRERTDTEKNLAFLNQLGESTRELLNPERIMEVTSRMLGQHMSASRAAYADVESDNNTFTIRHDYTDNCASSVGKYTLDPFGEQAAAAMRTGVTLVIRDIDTELTPETGADTFHALGALAIVCCPLVKFGKLVAMMAVHQAEPRDWRLSEIRLVQEVVERSWSTMERARAQQRLEQKERQFEDLFEFAPDAILMVDIQGDIALINHRAENMFQYSRHELIGRPVEILVPEKLRDGHTKLREEYTADRMHKAKVNSDPTLRGRRKDGSEFPVEISLGPMETERSEERR